jgi:hypothetical protein
VWCLNCVEEVYFMRMYKKNKTVRLTGLVMLAAMTVVSPSWGIDTKQEWDAAFNAFYAQQDPLLDLKEANDNGLFAWQGHYWIRAYVSMAATFGDTAYLDKAKKLIDFMLANRDDQRAARGEIDLIAQPYFTAPLPYLRNRPQPAPGWRTWDESYQGWRDLLVDDAQIVHAIMRYVDLVATDERFAAYWPSAINYIEKVDETVKAYDSSFQFDAFPDIPGSYYYENPDGNGLYSGAVEFNMDASMGCALLLLDKIKGGVPEYRRKAAAILAYWKAHLRQLSDGTLDWDYDLQNGQVKTTITSSQDVSHAHLDLSFLIMSYYSGLDLSDEVLRKCADTFIKTIYLGDGKIALSIDGKDRSEENYYPAGYDWVDLAEFEPQVLTIAKEVYQKNYPTPTWARPFLGWAEILRWTKCMKGQPPLPPEAVHLE